MYYCCTLIVSDFVSVSRSCRAVSDTSLVTTKPQSIQQQSIKGSVNLFDLCPHCTQYVQDGIACDKCDAWFHYKCVGLTEETGRARMAKTDYTFVVSVTFVRMICYIWTEAAWNSRKHRNNIQMNLNPMNPQLKKPA
jgi:hypothetical protein